MSNVNSTEFGKLYQFLANQGNNWYEEAAGQDGNLIYSEFYNYVTENWDGTGNTDADADLIKKFFNKLDTDTTGRIGKLTDKGTLEKNDEAKKLQIGVKYYQILQDFINSNSSLNSLDQSVKDGIETELFNKVLLEKIMPDGVDTISEPTKSELDKAFANALNAKDLITNICRILKDTIIKNKFSDLLAEHVPGFDPATSNDINNIVTALLNKGVTIDTLDNFTDQLEGYLQAYFSTIGNPDLAESNNYKLSDLGADVYSDNTLNELQLADRKNYLKEICIGDVVKDEYMADGGKIFDDYYTEFVNSILLNVDEFVKYKNGNYSGPNGYKTQLYNYVQENTFKTSEEFNQMQLAYKTYTELFVNLDIPSTDPDESEEYATATALLESLTEQLGKNLAQTIIENASSLPAYEKLINDVIELIKKGELKDTDDIIEHITNYIVDNIMDFVDGEQDNLPVDVIEKIYNIDVENAKKEDTVDKRLIAAQEAAIKACKSIVAKGGPYKTEVESIFGSNWADKIKEYKTNQLKEKMANLFENLKSIIDYAEIGLSDATWSALPDKIKIKEETKYNIKPTLNGDNPEEILGTITYSSSNERLVKVNISGEVLITPPATQNANKVTIKVMIDGVEVGSKEILIKKAYDMSKSQVNIDVQNDGRTDNDITIQKLLEDRSSTLELCSYHSLGATSLETMKTKSKTTITDFISKLANGLKTGSNVGDNEIDWAAKTLVNYYSAAIDAALKVSRSSTSRNTQRNLSFTYIDESGQQQSESTTFYEKKWSRRSTADGADGAKKLTKGSCGIQTSFSYKSTDAMKLFVNVACVVEKFEEMLMKFF